MTARRNGEALVRGPVGSLRFPEGAAPAEQEGKDTACHARLRKALLRPTRTAVRFNPLLKGFFERLVTSGKPKMQAVGACTRKRVMIAYGVLKNRSSFDSTRGVKMAP